MIVKSEILDLDETFSNLRKFNMRLNLAKCVFGVGGRKFLGFMLTDRGIEANRDKYATIVAMRSPQNLKEVQKLMGRLTSLSRCLL